MIEYENLKKVNEKFYDQFKDAFSNVLDSGWFILGNSVSTFEKEFAAYNEIEHCIGVASGLDALTMSLTALPKNDNKDEVLVPSNTYIATIISILNAGYKPVLVEPNIETYNIEASDIKEKITQKTKAVMVVHLYGLACNMEEISELCKEKNIYLIEDCAQAHGAEINGKKIGTFGDFGAFSFYPSKNLGALGDAGAVTTNNAEFAETIKMLRNYGSKVKYENEIVGINSRLDEVQAAFLSIKLKELDKLNSHKIKLAKIYEENIDNELIIKPKFYENRKSVYHIYPIRTKNRKSLREYLLSKGIKTEIHYPIAPHKQVAFKNLFNTEYPISEEIHNTVLSLPISFYHTKEDVDIIVEAINKYK